MYLYVDFLQFKYNMLRCKFSLVLILLVDLLASWICGLVFVSNFGKFSFIITSNILVLSLILLLVFPLYMLHLLYNCPHSSQIYCSFFSLLVFSFGHFLFLTFPFDSFLEFLFAYVTHLFLHLHFFY